MKCTKAAFERCQYNEKCWPGCLVSPNSDCVEFIERIEKETVQAVDKSGEDTVKQRSLHYLYGQLRKTRIAFGHAEEKQNNAEEIANLKNKIDVLEWTIGVVIKEDGKDA